MSQLTRTNDPLSWDTTTVLAAGTIAVTESLAVQESESLDRVAGLMVNHETSHVVVVGPDGLPAGIVSTLDVAEILAGTAEGQLPTTRDEP